MRAPTWAVAATLAALCLTALWMLPSPGAPGSKLDALRDHGRESLALIREAAVDSWRGASTAGQEAALEFAAGLLEQAIVARREQALQEGARPVPPAIRNQLLGYFPERLIDRVRHRVGWIEAKPLEARLFRLIHPRAVALGDVIVFRDHRLAEDPAIWAHELAHAEQYERWGVRGFASRYVADPEAVETEAWDVAARFTMWSLENGKPAGAIRSGSPEPH